jgi:hypothetical protein
VIRYVDSLTYAFGWSAFLFRIRFVTPLVVFFLKQTLSSSRGAREGGPRMVIYGGLGEYLTENIY